MSFSFQQQNLCKYSYSKIGATARGMVRIKKGEESDLMAAVAINGPVAVGIDHSHSAFQVKSIVLDKISILVLIVAVLQQRYIQRANLLLL